MRKKIMNFLFSEVVLLSILLITGVVVIYFTEYIFKDVLFLEGIVVIIFGMFSGISGNPSGLSLLGMGKDNAQYISNSNLGILNIEKEKSKNNLGAVISVRISMITFVLGGVLCVLISAVI
ncbi:hypothetical protein [Clostridium saccharoperbutylacetonicum]|uniref:hypothetical protein n=1 Tax=Clostridium saccharoperbutylacetonicum TaxID=36745 RepID=UPI0039E7EDAE